MISYYRSSNYCPILHRFRDTYEIFVENRKFLVGLPHLFSIAPVGVTTSEFHSRVDPVRKLE